MSNKNYLEIPLINYIPLNSYVSLTSRFRKKLFRILVKKFTIANLAKLVGAHRSSIYDWKKGRVRVPLSKIMRCIELAGITKDRLFNSITSLTALYNAGAIRIKGWKLLLNEELVEWLGLLKGDGYVSRKYVGCTNSSLPVSLFFMRILEKVFGIPKANIEITIEIPPNQRNKDITPLVKLLNTKGYKRIIKRKRNKGKKVLLSSRVNSKVLAQLLRNILKDLHQFINSSPLDVKIAYVRGFGAAEGSPYEVGSVRAISFSNKDLDELLFIKNILHEIGIIRIDNPEQDNKGIYKLKITTQPQLRLFHEIVGFGRNKRRNKKLASILKGYKKILKRVEYRSKYERYSQILNIIKRNKVATAKEIALEINISYTWTSTVSYTHLTLPTN